MRLVNSLPIFSTLTVVIAWDFGFFSRGVNAAQQTLTDIKPPTYRVAIIGAGAGGSSAAFWIEKARERHGMEVEVHVYDKSDYVGGRSTIVYPYDDKSMPSEELGASIFVKANKNLFRATEEFGLNVTDLSKEDDDLGIWDGSQILVTYRGSWWDSAKLLWRYGYWAPTRTTAIVAEMIEKLLTSYTPTLPLWKTIAELSQAVGFTEYTTQTTFDFFTSRGVGAKFVNEMIEAASRVNYAQDVTSIHGLEGSCSMAATGSAQVAGGNYQIFESFIAHSGAKLYLNSTITGLTKSATSGKTRWTLSGRSALPLVDYDQVIITTPFHLSGITLLGSSAEFPVVPYIHLHVTLLTTTSLRPLPGKFGLATGTAIPAMLLTTNQALRQGGKGPDFNSISYHRTIERNGQEEHVFKIFSMERKSDEWLEEVFGAGTLGWVHRKEWDSYPRLPPTATFPPIRADDGLWYVNSMEPWISTMETEVLSSRNVVDNMLREVFGKGICPDDASPDGWGTKIEDKKVYGWDC